MKKTSYRAAAELLAECVSEWAFYWLKAFLNIDMSWNDQEIQSTTIPMPKFLK